MNESGPKDCCLNEANLEVLRRFDRRGSLARCRVCERTHLSARMFFDEMCIEPMDYVLWQEVDPVQVAETEQDLADFIMNRKPYYARNVGAGGSYQRVD